MAHAPVLASEVAQPKKVYILAMIFSHGAVVTETEELVSCRRGYSICTAKAILQIALSGVAVKQQLYIKSAWDLISKKSLQRNSPKTLENLV